VNTYNSAEKASRKFQLKILSSTILMVLATNIAQAQNSNDDEVIDEVVVRGIASSLKTAIDFKRNSDVIVDSITAEDIGKFPDANIADSLQRVTGVQISRDRGGEGRFVSVRGLGSQFNMTTMNGRTLATDNAGRDFSFDVMPSELISQADVYKTSSATLEEGSIGGLISVKTRRPLDTPGLHVAGSLGGLYDEGTEKWGEQGTLVFSNSFNDDTIGASLGVTYSKREWHSNTYELLSANRTVDVPVDANNNPVTANEDHKVTAWMPEIVSYQLKFGERERLGFAGAFQFRPNDVWNSTLDFFYSNYRTPEGSYSYNINFGSSVAGSTVYQELAPWSSATRGITHIATKFTTTTELEMGTDTRERETDTYMVGWNNEFQVTDALKLSADIAYSEADRPNEGDDLYTVAGLKTANYSWDATNNAAPKIGCTISDGRNCWDVTNADLGLHYMDLKGEQVNDKATSLHFDGDYDFAFFDTESVLEFGVAYSEREKDKDIFKTPGSGCTYCFYHRKIGAVGIDAVEGYAEFDSGVDSGLPHFPALNPYALFAAARRYDVIENRPGRFDDEMAPEHKLERSTLIEEKNSAAYIQLNVKDEVWNANVGIRWINTDLTTSGYEVSPTILVPVVDETTGAESSTNYSLKTSDAAPVSYDASYDDILPSANLVINAWETSKLRLSASKTITRPSMTDLGTGTTWEIGAGLPKLRTNGNPYLKPIKSNNFDVSYEWYGDDGFSASAALYYKEISDWIFGGSREITYILPEFKEIGGQPQYNVTATWNAGTPLNGDSAELNGIELSVQKIFENGFGLQANYTFADTSSSTTVNGVKTDGELDGVSENTYNLVGFYETEVYSARLSYSYRDDYIAGAREGNWGNPKLNVDYQGLDLSLAYNINENISIYAEAQNLLEENGQTFWGDKTATHYYEQYYRRFEIGARFKF